MELLGVGERIKLVRGYETISKFAKKIDVHKSTLVRYEKEEGFPDAKTIIKICKTFHINPTWLLLGEGKKEAPKPPVTHTVAHNLLRERLNELHRPITFFTGFGVDNYRAYLRGEYLPTEDELKHLCNIVNWDFDTGQTTFELEKSKPAPSLASSGKKITETDCIFFLITEAMNETNSGLNASTMEHLSNITKTFWNELKEKIKEVLIMQKNKQ